MRIGGCDESDCFDCPMLAGLTDEQKRERIRTDPLIAKCLAARRNGAAATGKPRTAARRASRKECSLAPIDNAQGVDPVAG